MTAIEQPMEELPLLTRVVEESPDELPTLTEVIEKAPAVAEDELPVLTEAAATEPSNIPETEIGEDTALPALSETEMQLLVQQLEAHLESVFAQKLGRRLEQLQRLAVEQAVSELKAELPQMLRNALHSPDKNR